MKDQDGKNRDLLAAAALLFTMVAAHPPFTSAEAEDPFYKCLAENNSDKFWRAHCNTKPNGRSYFSDQLKDLITKMLKPSPSQRLCVSEILAHPWLQGEVASKETMKKYFQNKADSPRLESWEQNALQEEVPEDIFVRRPKLSKEEKNNYEIEFWKSCLTRVQSSNADLIAKLEVLLYKAHQEKALLRHVLPDSTLKSAFAGIADF